MPSPTPAQTALDLLVLTVLSRRAPLHGYGISTAIEELSEEALRIEEGSLYPALHRMEEAGWITAEWLISDTKRRVKFYSLSKEGRKQLEAETADWKRLSRAISAIVLPARS